MASGILVNIKEEVTCPICLELLTEPLSLDCGHSFCQACITAKNKESKIDQGGEGSCPVCRITYQPVNMRPNRHVANIVERLKEVRTSPHQWQKGALCENHGEKLHLFCKECEKAICKLCVMSPEHNSHQICFMEEAVMEIQVGPRVGNIVIKVICSFFLSYFITLVIKGLKTRSHGEKLLFSLLAPPEPSGTRQPAAEILPAFQKASRG
uniref:Uncharacterized protein n=1 Tax=Equus asinus asinus TaxID=83772 RepID=A0A8C4L0K0_EQUAS